MSQFSAVSSTLVIEMQSKLEPTYGKMNATYVRFLTSSIAPHFQLPRTFQHGTDQLHTVLEHFPLDLRLGNLIFTIIPSGPLHKCFIRAHMQAPVGREDGRYSAP